MSFVCSVLGLFGVTSSRSHALCRTPLRRQFTRTLATEGLEKRLVLSANPVADIIATDFTTDGADLQVEYDITGEAVGQFDIGIYRSSDGTTLDELLVSQRVTDSGKLGVGTGHVVSLDAAFNNIEEDYYLVAVVDSASEIEEVSEANNEATLAGGIFQTTGGAVHIHGTEGVDDLDITLNGSDLEVTLNSVTYSYDEAGVTSVMLRTYGGDDTVHLTTDVDTAHTAFLGSGDDTMEAGNGDDVIFGGTGDDDIEGYYGADRIYGEEGADWLVGAWGDDQLDGGAGNDALFGGDGDDNISAGDGADQIFADAGNDFADGGAGNDVVRGSSGDDDIEGGAGNDTLLGGTGDDTYKFAGSGSLGTDLLVEGINSGSDELDFSGLSGGEGIWLDMDSPMGAVQQITSDLSIRAYGMSYVEGVVATAYDDYIQGNALNNQIYGGAGDDIIFGNGGDDYLDGGSGLDTVDGGGQAGDVIADTPTITGFQGVEGHTVWTFTGTVVDDGNTDGLIIEFGGILAGYTTTVDADGFFSFSIELPPETFGTVTAQVTDEEGLDSPVVAWTI